ncbi:hypothetical protein M0C34_03550 [Agarivorans sp. TSD2052]|uniref:hypothetical protein n=1 Tax=Agarivorans sp. TSD2052 TaxID=2937286 RepID=UPI0020105D41|nr:hypothetical protein [Agarivorans sp. TSD2052]UPW19365.1 hypothetical protein M0C34_03550 [Agarivorans sp. TSD2052]
MIAVSDWLLLVFFIFAISMMIAWLVFSNMTMKRIEREFNQLGIERVDWDGPGFRVLSYATIIFFKTERMNDQNYQFVPVSATRKLATKRDWYLALWLWGSAIAMLGILLVLSIFFSELVADI